MKWTTLEAKLSSPRMSRYLEAERYDRARAAATYRLNMQITESLVVMFHVLEVVLRNAVHHEMKYSARREDWYEEWRDQPRLADLYGYIEAARAKLRKRKEKATPDKIVAELSFGFWTTLFNKKYMALTSKALMRVFRRCPNRLRQPGLIGARLNKTRELRNRCFHHEPIIWSAAQEIHAQACQLIHWISADLADWMGEHDRFPAVWGEWSEWRLDSTDGEPVQLGSSIGGTAVLTAP